VSYAQQPYPAQPPVGASTPAPKLIGEHKTIPNWLVTVVHKVSQQELEQLVARRGLAPGRIIRQPINITTGLIVQNKGLIVTKLVNINPQAGEARIGDISVILPTGKQYRATFKGIDGSTGLCLLAIDETQSLPAKIAQTDLPLGAKFTLLNIQVDSRPRPRRRAPLDGKNTTPEVECAYALQSVVLNSVLPDGQLLMAAQNIFPVMRLVRPLGVVLNEKEEVAGIVTGILGNYLAVVDAREAVVAAQRVIERGGNVPRVWLGLECSQQATTAAEQEITAVSQGVRVTKVIPTGPAMQAGFQPGDLLLRLDGKPIRTTADLQAIMRRQFAGEEVSIDLVRQNELLHLPVKLGEGGYTTALGGNRITQEARQYTLNQELTDTQSRLEEMLRQYGAIKASQDSLAVLGNNRENQTELTPSINLEALARQIEAIRQYRALLQKRLNKADESFTKEFTQPSAAVASEWLGVEIEEFSWSEKDSRVNRITGVAIRKVLPNSIAQRLGLLPKDVISRINIYLISGPTDLKAVLTLLRQSKLDSLEFEVTRQGRKQTFRLEAGDLALPK
jgi:S1-C subfamily serine protease